MSGEKWSVKEVLEHNIEKSLKGGPGLAYGRRTTRKARCACGKYVLAVGLGVFGVGEMWIERGYYEDFDPDLLVEQCESCPECGGKKP